MFAFSGLEDNYYNNIQLLKRLVEEASRVETEYKSKLRKSGQNERRRKENTDLWRPKKRRIGSQK